MTLLEFSRKVLRTAWGESEIDTAIDMDTNKPNLVIHVNDK